jgi:aminoglycoside 2''-phosphotransferase
MYPKEDSINVYRHQLQQDFPELVITKIQQIGSGWDHVALEVNNDIIFRMPEDMQFDAEQVATVTYETAVLKKLHDALPVAIPEPTYIAPKGSYFGYPKLKGIIAEKSWPELNAEQRARLREDWVAVVADIEQHISPNEARQLSVPYFWVEDSVENARKLLTLHTLTPRYKQFVERALYEAESLDVRHDALFLHNDFYLHNTLLNPETKRLSALIDWSDCCLAPIEREFALWCSLPASQLDAIVALYTEKTGRQVNTAQVKTWAHIEACSDLYTQFLEDDVEGQASTLRHFDRWTS